MSDDPQLFKIRMMRNTRVRNALTGEMESCTPLRKNPKTGFTELSEVFVTVNEEHCIYLCAKRKAVPSCKHSEKLMKDRLRCE